MGLSRTPEGIIKEVKEISELIDKVKYFQFFYPKLIGEYINEDTYQRLIKIKKYRNTLSIDRTEDFSKPNQLLDAIYILGFRIEPIKNRIEELKRLLFVPDTLRIAETSKGGSRKTKKTRKTRKTIKASKSSTKNKTTKKSKKAKAPRRRQSRKTKNTKKASKVSTNPKK